MTFEEYAISKRMTDLFRLYKNGNEHLPKGFGGEHFADNTDIKIKNKHLKTALELLTIFDKDGSEVKFFDFIPIPETRSAQVVQ